MLIQLPPTRSTSTHPCHLTAFDSTHHHHRYSPACAPAYTPAVHPLPAATYDSFARGPIHSTASYSTSSTALQSYNPLTAAVATSPITAVTSFLQLALVFTAGGLFFSSAMAACTASYAIGMDNVQRFVMMARIVGDNIWKTFVMGLAASKATLLGTTTDYYYDANGQTKPSWHWRDAWRVLRQKLAETKRQCVQGVEAIKKEAKLLAAAVGPPGLIPLQYVLDRLMPTMIASALEESLRNSLQDVQLTANNKLVLAHFAAGTQAPKLEAARVYDLGNHAMAFDCDVLWESELEATIHLTAAGGLAWVPVTLKNARFQGTVRIVLTPLTKDAPGFGATLISFPTMPDIGLDMNVAGGEVTRVVPRLRAELIASIQRSIGNYMLWPQRIVCPSVGMSDKPILSQQELQALTKRDPLLQAEEALGSRPLLRRKVNQISNILYHDNTAAEEKEMLQSIVVLPMPSFQMDHVDAAATSTTKTTSSKKPTSSTRSPTSTLQHGIAWEHLLQAHEHVQQHTAAKADEFKMLQNTLWEHLQTLQQQQSNTKTHNQLKQLQNKMWEHWQKLKQHSTGVRRKTQQPKNKGQRRHRHQSLV